MAVTREDVLHVAKLARLHLGGADVQLFTAQLNSILQHMEELKELDVGAVEAVAGATEWEAPLRPEETPPDPLALAQSEIAPASEQGFFTVPRLPALDAAALDEPFADKARAEPEHAGRPEPGT